MIPVFGAVAIAGIAAAAWSRAKPRAQAQPTPTTRWIFQRVLDAKLAPDEYRKMADGFERHGYLEEARVLRSRASYGELPPEVREGHKWACQQALLSNNGPVIRQIADLLYAQGAIANATRLRNHANAVEAAARVAPVPPAPPPEPEEPEEAEPPPAASVEQEDTPAPGEPHLAEGEEAAE
jgi:hypothetical protein